MSNITEILKRCESEDKQISKEAYDELDMYMKTAETLDHKWQVVICQTIEKQVPLTEMKNSDMCDFAYGGIVIPKRIVICGFLATKEEAEEYVDFFKETHTRFGEVEFYRCITEVIGEIDEARTLSML